MLLHRLSHPVNRRIDRIVVLQDEKRLVPGGDKLLDTHVGSLEEVH